MKKWVLAGLAVAVAGGLWAGPLKGHGHMKAAHVKIKAAIVDMEKAQKANEYDLGGHAAKAIQLLRDAEKEIAQAGMVADEHKK